MESMLKRGIVVATLVGVLAGCGAAASQEDGQQQAAAVDEAAPSPALEAPTAAAPATDPKDLLVAEVSEVVAVPGRGRQWKVSGKVRNDGESEQHAVEIVVRLNSRIDSLPVATHAMEVAFEDGLAPGAEAAWEVTMSLPRSSAAEVVGEAEVVGLIEPEEPVEAWKPLVLPAA